MILAVACVLSVLASIALFALGRRQAGAQRLPVDEEGHGRGTRRLPLPGRLVYLVAVAVLAAAAGLLAWTVDGGESHPPSLPGETVLAIDLSGSITLQGNKLIARTLDGFRDYPPSRHAAVVYFSSTAALASLPSAPAADLSGLARFFALTKSRTRGPWSASFDGGTVISRAIGLARRVLARTHTRTGRVVLLSDLEDNPRDLPRLHRQLLLLRQAHASLEVLALPVTRNDSIALEQLSAPYRAVFGDGILVSKPDLVAGTHGRPFRETSILRPQHATLALVLALLLGASALAVGFFPRLAWRLG